LDESIEMASKLLMGCQNTISLKHRIVILFSQKRKNL